MLFLKTFLDVCSRGRKNIKDPHFIEFFITDEKTVAMPH
jgi:hypothetical protein